MKQSPLPSTPGREGYELSDSLLPGDAKGCTKKQLKDLREGRLFHDSLFENMKGDTKVGARAGWKKVHDSVRTDDPSWAMGKLAKRVRITSCKSP